MAIASSIFWIIAGLLYILYRAYKEDAAQTMRFMVLLSIILGTIFGFLFLQKLMFEINFTVGAVFSVIGICALIGVPLYFKCKFDKEQDDLARKNKEEQFATRRRYETHSHTEEDIARFIAEFRDKNGVAELKRQLRRDPTDAEIRDAAIKRAEDRYWQMVKSCNEILKV